jgi:hypothetical protein
MARHRLTDRKFRRLSTDFALSLLIFYALLTTFAGDRDHASVARLAKLTPRPLMEYTVNVPRYVFDVGADPASFTSVQSPHQRLTFVLLAVTFAAMTAFNLAIWRHVRRAYSTPKRRMPRHI